MNFHQILALGKLADYTFGNNLCSLQGERKLFLHISDMHHVYVFSRLCYVHGHLSSPKLVIR